MPSRSRSTSASPPPFGARSSSVRSGEHGRIVLARDVDQAIDLVERVRARSTCRSTSPIPRRRPPGCTDAGSVFVGRWAPESAGDYATGANHVLPTGGLARACGPLAVETFGKFLQVQRLTRAGLAALRPTIRALAEAEGLHAHRDAVEARFTDDR